MSKVHLFNPENDIALASGVQQFTAPKAAVALRNAGAALPIWYAQPTDRILAYGINAKWLESIQCNFGIDVDLFDHRSFDIYAPSPWGWSAAVHHEFAIEGFSKEHLPSLKQIEQWRQFSHRRTASVLCNAIARKLDFDIAPAATEINDINALYNHLKEYPACIIKSPWSSSGRGLIDSRHLKADEIIRRCKGIIRKQGSVMVEKAYDRIADFAMLFECADQRCSFVGYSLFKTDDKGNYCGNLLADDNTIAEEIGNLYPRERIEKVASALELAITNNIAPYYDGPLGIDMLIARMPDGSHLLDATVEINLRMTMGFVAHSLSSKYIMPGYRGTYSVIQSQRTPDLDNAIIEDRRIVGGRMMLTPPGGQFSFIVEID